MRSNRTGRTKETAEDFKIHGSFSLWLSFAYFVQIAFLTIF